MRMFFKQFILAESDFQSFQQFLQQNRINFPELIARLQAGEPTGRGGNAKFYKIPGSDFGVRIMHRGFKPDETDAELTPVHDPFGGENLGQSVAQYGNNVQVVRLQGGTPAGYPYRPADKSKAIQVYRQQIMAAAAIDVKEYIRLFKVIKKLNDDGYVVDPSKSGNLLIDADKGKFNLVDIGKRESEGYRNTAGEIIQMLMDNYSFSSNKFSRDADMKKAAQEIIRKAEYASEEAGLELADTMSSVDYSYNLAGLRGEPEPEPEERPEPVKPTDPFAGWSFAD